MDIRSLFNAKYQQNPKAFNTGVMPLVKDAVSIVLDSGRAGPKALDLGVGNGRNALYLLEKGFSVVGVDLSEEGLALLKNRAPEGAPLTLVHSDVRDFETEDRFDLVLGMGLLHFLELHDVQKVVSNMQRFADVEGLNVIATRMEQNRRGDLPHIFAPGELRAFYELPNWEILRYAEGPSRYSGAEVARIIARKLA